MSKIEELLKQYPEEIHLNTITGKLISGTINWRNNPIVLQFESADSGQILFSLDRQPIRVATRYKYQHGINFEQNKGAFFNVIFWINDFKDSFLEINTYSVVTARDSLENWRLGTAIISFPPIKLKSWRNYRRI